jgi:hypothetical protein
MANAKRNQKQATQAAAPAPASTMPTLATLPAAPAAPAPATVALRGGAAVAQVALTGKPYRTAAPHNQQWWQAVTQAATPGPAAVAPLLPSPTNANGVPAHFIGYCLRRGYLQAA